MRLRLGQRAPDRSPKFRHVFSPISDGDGGEVVADDHVAVVVLGGMAAYFRRRQLDLSKEFS
jgi:hypothetical protein